MKGAKASIFFAFEACREKGMRMHCNQAEDTACSFSRLFSTGAALAILLLRTEARSEVKEVIRYNQEKNPRGGQQINVRNAMRVRDANGRQVCLPFQNSIVRYEEDSNRNLTVRYDKFLDRNMCRIAFVQ